MRVLVLFMPSPYQSLLSDRQVRRWYDNVGRGAPVTADVYLRRLGNFCRLQGVTPAQLTQLEEHQLHGLLLDLVTAFEARGRAGGYVANVLKGVKSWLAFNGVLLRMPIKIRCAQDTPTLHDERVPTQAELRSILLAGDPRQRAICALLAHAGLRPEVIGDYRGTDGLRLADLPELEVAGSEVRFTRVPTLVRVRANLSKKRHPYLTFLTHEGCEYLTAYLGGRLRAGEVLTGQSPLVQPTSAKKDFISSTNIGDAARLAIRAAGTQWRPYVLRSYFATQLMLAESKGLILRDYRCFFLGHKGDIESVYTLNKRVLPVDVIDELRRSYARAQVFLETDGREPQQEDVTRAFKRQLLLVAGFSADEIGDEQLSANDEQFRSLVRDRLVGPRRPACQDIIPAGSLATRLHDGWEFVSLLPDGNAIVRRPES